MVKLCIWRIVEQEQGIYQWAGMLEEARRGETNSDHADYVGPIEVRVCEDPRCGRGLFATKDVEPGELLLVEKAFSAAFAKRGECSEEVWKPDRPAGDGARPKPDEIEEKAREEIVALCAELGTLTFVKIARNRSLEPAFLDLYPGANTDEEVDKRKNSIFTKLVVPFSHQILLHIHRANRIPRGAIQNRLAYNAFAFPLISLPASNVTKPVSTVTPSRGVWLQASYINHTCNPNIHRSFISDLIILRAQAHIPRDTELRLGYTSCFEPVSQRRAFLSHYGFNCECERCITEAGTPQADLETRDKISMEIERLMEGNDGMGVGVYMKMLEVFDATYKTTQSVEPRLAFVSPLLNILAAAKAEDMHVHVISLVCRLLRSLGFVVRVSLHGGEKRFEILKWGFLIDEIVIAMTDLVQAFEALGQEGWRRGAEREAKKCYLIMCGEDSSWNEVYTEGGDGVEKEGVGRC